MEITISKDYPYKFLLYLITFFRKMLLGYIDIRRLKKIENDYNYIIEISHGEHEYINVVSLVINCHKYMTIKEFDKEYKLGFDNSKAYENTSLKIIDILKFVNYGNANSTAYSIFTKTFLYIEKNLSYIYNMYSFTGGDF